jgi:hypothetical protein
VILATPLLEELLLELLEELLDELLDELLELLDELLELLDELLDELFEELLELLELVPVGVPLSPALSPPQALNRAVIKRASNFFIIIIPKNDACVRSHRQNSPSIGVRGYFAVALLGLRNACIFLFYRTRGSLRSKAQNAISL